MKQLSFRLFSIALFGALMLSGCTEALIKSGDEAYENLSYSKAIEKYEKAHQKAPENIDVQLKLANAYRQVNNSKQAAKYYQMVADSITLPVDEQLNYAQVLMKNKNYDLAKQYLQSFLAENPNHEVANALLASINTMDQMVEDTSAYILESLPLDFTVSMFGPVHYKDGLVFAGETEIVSAASTNPWTGYSYLDLFYIDTLSDGTWDIAEPFDNTLNGKFHDGPATFNKAQDWIIYTRSALRKEDKRLVNERNENQFYLYESRLVDGKWTDPIELPFNNPAYSVGHPTLSADGTTLYFSSNMPGGYGGSDLYKSTYNGTNWSEPVNLGDGINTPGNEVFPYISDSNDLYFSSNGHKTLGGLDVYVTQNRGGIWGKPVNLAYPLNTSQDDFAIIFNPGDTTGYVSSDREGVDMIYSFTRVPPVYVVDGMATLKATGEPLKDVKVTLMNLTDGNEMEVLTGKDGVFKFNLLANKQYRLKGEKEGYFTLTEDFATGRESLEKEVAFEFVLDEIVASEAGTGSGTSADGTGSAAKTYDIGDIFYDFDKAAIRPEAKPILDKLAKLLKDNSSLKIEIQAHTDSRGSHSYNQKLSERRAQSVVDYLIKKDIPKSRLQTKGFGETRPVNGCVDGVECTRAQHQQNRRTEFIVLE